MGGVGNVSEHYLLQLILGHSKENNDENTAKKDIFQRIINLSNVNLKLHYKNLHIVWLHPNRNSILSNH